MSGTRPPGRITTPPGQTRQATVLHDPAASLSAADRANRGTVRAARFAAWKRPATKAVRATERQQRIETVYACYPALEA